MTPGRTATVSVSLPKSLVRDLDPWVGKHGYSSRAEIAKESIRLRLEQLDRYAKWLKELKRK